MGTGVGWLTTGSGLIIVPAGVGAGGLATAVFIGEDLGSVISLVIVVTGLVPEQIADISVGTPGEAPPTRGAGLLGDVPAAGSGDFAASAGDQTLGELVLAIEAAGCTVLSVSIFDADGEVFEFLFPDIPLISDLTLDNTLALGDVVFIACE